MEQPLNFNWHYIRGFSSSYPAEIPSETEQINLPHNMVDFPFNHFSDIHHQVVGTYFKRVTIDNYDPEKIIYSLF